MENGISARERYERGRTLRQNKLYKQALTELQEAMHDPNYRGKAYTQTGLCLRALGRHEEAITALRHALNSSSLSSNEYMHVLYLLGQSLESLARYAEAIEVYNWVRQENPEFLDVDARIKNLCGVRRNFWSRPLKSVDLIHLGRSLMDRFGRC